LKICEVCGKEEGLNEESVKNGTHLIHICENCQSDRRYDWESTEM